jgi:hypothetical protein
MRLAAKSSSQAATFRRKEKLNHEGPTGTKNIWTAAVCSLGVFDC